MPKRSVASLAIATLVAALLLAACGDDSATAPAGSPLGRVAFVRDGDLWVADLDGADEKKLVDADSLDLGEVPSPKPIPGSKYIPYIERPEWSADGEWLSFAVPRHVDGPSGGLGAWFRVFVVRPDGTDLMEPWSEAIREFGPGFYGVRDWKWSPIGAELATAVFGAPPGVFYIRVFDPAKQSDAWPFVPQILTSGFEWLPGGGQIAVNFGGDPFDPSPVRNYRLVLYERTASSGTPYTGQEEPVYEYQGPFTYPRLHTVAPDSSRILLWDSSESGPPVQPLSAVSLDGSGAKTHIIDTYHVADWAAVWSPDSTAIAVIQGGERMGWRGRRLVVAKPDGGRLLDNSSEGMSDTNPAWSPDGARIAFVRAPERPQNTGLAEGHIWITPREGPAAQITDDPAYTERFPQWTPDGSAILFVRLPADAVEQEKVTPELWAMSPNGGNQRRVLELGEMPGATAGMEDDWGYLFDWKPEGEKPLPTGSVPSTPLASPTQSPQVPELRQGEPAEFPGDMAMIIETGCWGCSGGPGTLIRFYRNSSGQVQQETLLSADRLNLPTHPLDTPDGPREYPAWINGLAMEPTASIIAVSFCIRGYCGPGGESAWSADSLAVIFESTDGGVTWQEVTRGGSALAVVGVFTDGRILTVRYTEDLGPPHYSIIPDNTQVYPPAGGERPFTTSGQILWVTADGRLLLPDGTEFYRQEAGSPDIYHQQLLGEFSGNLEKGSALVKWPLASPEGEAYAITLLEVSQGETNVTGTFRSTHDLYLGWWTPKGMRAVISVMPARPFDDLGAPLPALLDLTTGEYRPIPGPSVSADPPYPRWQTGRTIIDAVQTGPFARVVDTGSCLNIRDAPSAAANVLACAADGVLLTVTNPAPTVPPGVVTPPPLAGWLEVLTPAGVAGWVSTQYLER